MTPIQRLKVVTGAHCLPVIVTEDGTNCVADRVYNGWAARLVEAWNEAPNLRHKVDLAKDAGDDAARRADRLQVALELWMRDYRAVAAVAGDCTNGDGCGCVYCESQRALF